MLNLILYFKDNIDIQPQQPPITETEDKQKCTSNDENEAMDPLPTAKSHPKQIIVCFSCLFSCIFQKPYISLLIFKNVYVTGMRK